jgi:hypothetical protein
MLYGLVAVFWEAQNISPKCVTVEKITKKEGHRYVDIILYFQQNFEIS